MTLLSTLRTPGLLLCALNLWASSAPLPSAARVLDRYVEVTGGRAAWASKHTETDELEGRSLDGAHVLLRATVNVSRNGDALTRLAQPEEAQEGVFKGAAWALTKLSGARIKHGPDRDEALRSARMLEEGRWREFYPRSRVEAVDVIDGRPCYRIALLPSQDQRTEWFDVQTGLLAKKAWIGDAHHEFTIEAWRTQDGIKQPATLLALRDELRYRLYVLDTRYNQAVAFTPPAAVAKALLPGALPNAEELIERHIFESGGADAYSRLKSQRVAGTLEFVDRNMVAQTEAVSAGGGRYYQSVDTPGLGKTEQGSDGAIDWERSPTFGPRARPRNNLHGLGLTLEAAEVVGWRYLLSSVETQAQETVDGHDCYRVHLTLRSGKDGGTRWYDRKTGLLYRTSAAMKTEMGSVPTVLTYLEYRPVAGLKWPVRIHMAMGGQELIFLARDVELNSPINDSVFAMPEDVRTVACNEVACPVP